MKLHLDWSSYENAGQGDAYAGIPATGGDFAKAVSVCIRDKLCQSKPKGVMCPSYRATDDPRQSPGARVEVLKAALNGELGADAFGGNELAQAMDLCVGCKGCKRECANSVDMAAIKIEYQAQRNQILGVPLRDRLFAGLPRWMMFPRLFAGLVSWRNRSPLLAGVGERWLGISARRRMPQPASRPYVPPFSAGARADRQAILFVDTFSRYFEPEIASAAHAVLTAAGYDVQVLAPADGDGEPDRPLCCGRTYLSLGQVEAARKEASRMLAALRPAIEAGLPIVGLEPSCILSLRDEHLKLGLGPEAEKLSKQVWLFEEFIARESDKKKLELTLGPVAQPKVLVHGHCHQKAVGAMKSLRKVLRLIPGLEFEFIESSCCGMSGSFGLDAEHRDISMAMAEAELLPTVRAADDGTTLVANGFSCRHQILEGADRQAVHVAILLREALAV